VDGHADVADADAAVAVAVAAADSSSVVAGLRKGPDRGQAPLSRAGLARQPFRIGRRTPALYSRN
jgi:hypothetical protein